MMKNRLFFTLIVAFSFLFSANGEVKEFVFESSETDMTPIIRDILEKAEGNEIKLIFKKGEYKFLPDLAHQEYRYITNHENGLKNVIFFFNSSKSVVIEGNGAEFIFHGRLLPFAFNDCDNVKINDIVIDWDIPFTFQGDVVAVNDEDGWYDLKPYKDGFSWIFQRGRILFPNIDGFNFSALGSRLAFEKEPKRVAHGAKDGFSRPERVEKLKNGNLRFYESLRYNPKIGEVMHFKGPKGENRYAPAFHFVSSNDIEVEGVTIHHALGMGFLGERCENITIEDCGIFVRDGSPRVVSTIADATHFSNCRGHVVIEGCRFEQMLDDGTNVHGTYVEVDSVLDYNKLRFQLKHFQQFGFMFADEGDEIWFIHQPDPGRKEVNTVVSAEMINDQYGVLVFENGLADDLQAGDILENKSWNPVFIMRNCTIQNNRARGILLKSPLKTVIEDNYFSTMMSAVQFRGETYYWFESGAVKDVLIRNNHFGHSAYSGVEHAIMYITPRLGPGFDETIVYDEDIRFVDNYIENFDNRIVIADRAKGLVIRGNEIVKVPKEGGQLYPDAPLFDLINCEHVEIVGNSYVGEFKDAIKGDEKSLKTLKEKRNKGF